MSAVNMLQRGDAAEAALISALVERGFEVLLPFSRSSAYDVAVAVGDHRFLRIQCKCGHVRDGCVVSTPRELITEAVHGTTKDVPICSECAARNLGGPF